MKQKMKNTSSRAFNYRKKKYLQYRKMLDKIIISAKRNYYQKIFKKNEKNGKETWRCINEVLQRDKSKNTGSTDKSKIKKIRLNENTYTDNKAIVDIVNDYFVNIAGENKHSRT